MEKKKEKNKVLENLTTFPFPQAIGLHKYNVKMVRELFVGFPISCLKKGEDKM
jgi:hypothetical protein